ncbi:hypothetical protein CYMTET_3874 [Cymbomonas tetramitiformis]|uniref:Exonuclease domain-containing protein n=1 Tax=Cymbomonas tetramitiformis TaxID=36881 RepID=A0AAE0H2J6_9CHLO|nr:hypothetical protein CYMTET_3874 [Cymbomonas tetramitiformis]
MNRTLVFDLETTGLSVANASIISLAIRILETNQSLHELVRPPRLPIPRQITNVTGITTECLRKKATWATVGRRVCWWLTHTVLRNRTDAKITLVGHNCRKFDVPIFLRHLGLLKPVVPIEVERCAVIDTLRLLRRSLPQLENHKQESVYKHLFQTAQPNAHSAIGDVEALTRILQDPRSKFGESRRTVRYDIWEHHDLESCKNVFIAGRSQGMRAYFNTSSKQARCDPESPANSVIAPSTQDDTVHRRSVRCDKCFVVFSEWFSHRCST